jgi:hypothetical protein
MANSKKLVEPLDQEQITRHNIEVWRRNGMSDRLIAIEMKLRTPEEYKHWGLNVPRPKTCNTPPRDADPKPVRVGRRDPATLLKERARRLRLAREEFERVRSLRQPTSLKAISRAIGVEPSFWGWRINQAKDRTFIQFRDEIELWNQSLREQQP